MAAGDDSSSRLLRRCSLRDLEAAIEIQRLSKNHEASKRREKVVAIALRQARAKLHALHRRIACILSGREDERPAPPPMPLGDAVASIERAMLQKALAASRSAQEAARVLGIVRSQFYRLCERHGVQPHPERPGPHAKCRHAPPSASRAR